MKFTIDLMFGFAHPGMTMVRNNPDGMRGWFFKLLRRKMVAPDGYVYMYAIRLLGTTLGVTVTRECATPLTSQQPASSPPQQLPPEVMAQVAALQKSAATTKTTASPAP